MGELTQVCPFRHLLPRIPTSLTFYDSSVDYDFREPHEIGRVPNPKYTKIEIVVQLGQGKKKDLFSLRPSHIRIKVCITDGSKFLSYLVS